MVSELTFPVRVGSLLMYPGRSTVEGVQTVFPPRRGIVFEIDDNCVQVFWDTKGIKYLSMSLIEEFVGRGVYVVEVF